MICRSVIDPDYSERTIKTFDYFNDYSDTMSFLAEICLDNKGRAYPIEAKAIKQLMDGLKAYCKSSGWNADAFLSPEVTKVLSNALENIADPHEGITKIMIDNSLWIMKDVASAARALKVPKDVFEKKMKEFGVEFQLTENNSEVSLQEKKDRAVRFFRKTYDFSAASEMPIELVMVGSFKAGWDACSNEHQETSKGEVSSGGFVEGLDLQKPALLDPRAGVYLSQDVKNLVAKLQSQLDLANSRLNLQDIKVATLRKHQDDLAAANQKIADLQKAISDAASCVNGLVTQVKETT